MVTGSVVIVSGNSRLRSTIRRPHPPYRLVLGHIHCFRQCEIMGTQLLLYTLCILNHVMWGCPRSLQSSGGRVDRILLASELSSICAMCPKRVRRRHWTIAVSLSCPIRLRTSWFRTNWCHLIRNSIFRHRWSNASIFCASVFETLQQSDPYRKIGRMHALYKRQLCCCRNMWPPTQFRLSRIQALGMLYLLFV